MAFLVCDWSTTHALTSCSACHLVTTRFKPQTIRTSMTLYIKYVANWHCSLPYSQFTMAMTRDKIDSIQVLLTFFSVSLMQNHSNAATTWTWYAQDAIMNASITMLSILYMMVCGRSLEGALLACAWYHTIFGGVEHANEIDDVWHASMYTFHLIGVSCIDTDYVETIENSTLGSIRTLKARKRVLMGSFKGEVHLLSKKHCKSSMLSTHAIHQRISVVCHRLYARNAIFWRCGIMSCVLMYWRAWWAH